MEALYWYLSIFLWSFFTGIGVPPIPEEAGILYAAGLSAVHSDMRWWLAWPAASLGIIGADLVLYGAGWVWGPHLLERRWVARILPPERRKRIEERFHQHGMKFLLMARLLPPLRTGVFLIAGSIRYSLLRFLIADICYGVVGVGLVFFGGTALLTLIHYVGNWFLFALAIVVVGVATLWYYRYLRKLELKASEPVVAAVAPLVEPRDESKTTVGAGSAPVGR